MSYASASDVEISLGRELSDSENSQAAGLLDRIEARIEARIPTLVARLADETNLEALLIEVEADAVARVIRNPDGLLTEQDGDYMYTRDRRVSSGALDLTDDEWSRLGITKGAFSIAPALAGRTPGENPPGYGFELLDGQWTEL